MEYLVTMLAATTALFGLIAWYLYYQMDYWHRRALEAEKTLDGFSRQLGRDEMVRRFKEIADGS